MTEMAYGQVMTGAEFIFGDTPLEELGQDLARYRPRRLTAVEAMPPDAVAWHNLWNEVDMLTHLIGFTPGIAEVWGHVRRGDLVAARKRLGWELACNPGAEQYML